MPAKLWISSSVTSASVLAKKSRLFLFPILTANEVKRENVIALNKKSGLAGMSTVVMERKARENYSRGSVDQEARTGFFCRCLLRRMLGSLRGTIECRG
ncbi:hypothetical protein BDV12DRAFT_178880 [Aspergillus spectabilis]